METKLKRGRKPVADKKQNVTIYLQKSTIEKLGGKNALKELLHQTIKQNETKN
jgi:hypothetical protein